MDQNGSQRDDMAFSAAQTLADRLRPVKAKAKQHPANVVLHDTKTYPVAYVEDGVLTLYKADKGQDLNSQIAAWFQSDSAHDQFGPLAKNQTVQPDILLFPHEMNQSRMTQPATFSLAALKLLTHAHCHWDPTDCSFHMTGDGDRTQAQTAMEFWTSLLSQQELQMLGLMVSGEFTKTGFHCQFSASTTSCPLPPQGFWNLLSVRASRKILDELSHDEGMPVTIKWLSRPLWKGKLAPNVTMNQLEGILEATMMPALCPAMPRMIHNGKRATGPLQVGEMKIAAHAESILIHIGHSLVGGGKEHTRTQIKNAIASTLLENGFDLKWVTSAVEDVLTKAGSTQAMYAAQMPGGTNRFEKVIQLIKDCQIDIPSEKLKQAAKQTAHNISTKQRKMQPVAPDPTQYRMVPGYLLNTDGTAAQQINQLTSSACGVILMSHQDAMPWLREGKTISRDELAMFVLGSPVESQQLHVQVLHLPCRDAQDRQVILSGSLVQLGAKPVSPQEDKSKKVDLQDCHVVSMTLWKSDFPEDEWAKLISHTFATLKNMLGDHGTKEHVTAMWGRSLRGTHGPSNEASAKSIQVHATVTKDTLIPMLVKSGFNKIFINPKSDSGRPQEQFRVLWIQGDLAHVTATAASTENCCGLIRGKRSYGLRYTQDGFKMAWTNLHPGEEVPEQLGGAHTFKLEPLPFGVTQQSLHEWALLYKWKIRAIKALGPRTWLITSADQPPEQLLQFNGHPLIARYIPPKTQAPAQSIIAGPRPRKGSGKGKQTSTPEGTLSQDPWATYLARNSQGSHPATQPPRSNEGPIEAKFKQQDAKIQQLEATIKSVAATQQQCQQQTDMQFQQVQQQITDTNHLFAKTLERTKADIQKSVDQAMQVQSNQLNQNLAEIKALLMKPSKRERENEPEDMHQD